MKRLLLPLLAALALSAAIKAESYSAGVAKSQLPHMEKLLENAQGFVKIGDWNTACIKLREFDLLLGMNFEGLQEIRPNTDWFELKEHLNMMIKKYC
tara:strand:- start:2327 stop:2617 length:291 start_codon:yes stop_codon:yes gene_type:complete